MKNSIKILICTLSIIIFGSVLNAEEKKNIVHDSLNGKIIELKEGKVVDAKLSKDVEYYVLYHSASWWGGCKSVTKQLVSLNKKNNELGKKKKFQLVLVDYDRTKEGLAKYLKSSKMNWPAIKLDQMKSVKKLTSLGETGFIPNVVLLKPDGSMVSNNKEEVIKKLEKYTGS